jgi:hypothetical protein
MGLLDKLMGTRGPAPGVAPVGVDELRAALIGLSRDSAPWSVRDGAQDGCDLIAEWRIVDARWYGIFLGYGLSKTFRVKLKFDEGAHEVRNVDEQATITWRDGIPSISKSWSRGQINEVESGRGVGFTEEGALGEVYNYKFRSSEIKDPLRDAITQHGWGWKAVSFKL